MNRTRTHVLAATVGGSAFVAAIVWAYRVGLLSTFPTVILALLGMVLDVVLTMLSWPREKPRLVVDPLPHLKGWMEPSGGNESFYFFEGEDPKAVSKSKWGHPSHPERVGHGIHLSQVLELVWPDPEAHPGGKLVPDSSGNARLKLKWLAFKFGVLSVTNPGGEAEGCRVDGRYRVRGYSTLIHLYKLSLYSHTKRLALKTNNARMEAISRSPAEGLNRDLAKESVDVPADTTKADEYDVPLFYMRFRAPYVYFPSSSSLPVEKLGSPDVPLRFEMKVRFRGRGMSPLRKHNSVTAMWDDFQIVDEDAQ